MASCTDAQMSSFRDDTNGSLLAHAEGGLAFEAAELQSYPGILGLENANASGCPWAQLIHYRAAWVGQSDEFGHLVEGLSRGIVERLT